MKIAFISYEYPPDTAVGGIATYVFHAARMLANRGHSVDVFSGSPTRDVSGDESGITVHRLRSANWREFVGRVGPVALARHRAVGNFEVVESPEYNAEAAEFLRLAPDVPLVVKLHTPAYLIGRYTSPPLDGWQMLRFALGAWRRGQRPRWPQPWRNERHHAFERDFTRSADEVAAPTRAIADIVAGDWQLDPERLVHFPYPFEAPPQLLALPLSGDAEPTVLFVGRLEPRKGVHHLAAAIPIVRHRHPNARFCFVGRNLHSPRPGEPMDAHIRRVAGPAHGGAIQFTGPVSTPELAGYLGAATVAVFPSLWENSANVCLEAMAAGRAIVAGSAGGLPELLGEGSAGVLVPPSRPRRLAQAIIELLSHPSDRIRLGEAARKRLREVYDPTVVAPQQEASYARAVARRQAAGPRSSNLFVRPEAA